MGDILKFVQTIDVPIMLCMSDLGEVSKSLRVKWIMSSYATT